MGLVTVWLAQRSNPFTIMCLSITAEKGRPEPFSRRPHLVSYRGENSDSSRTFICKELSTAIWLGGDERARRKLGNVQEWSLHGNVLLYTVLTGE